MIATRFHRIGIPSGILLLSAASSTIPPEADGKTVSKKPVDRGVAVVELYTSAWCGKCPPVETMLSKLFEEADKDDRPVYMLAFHVDYFDIEGRRDPFSSNAFTERQHVYVEAFGEENAGTPHVIVNGLGGGFGPPEDQARDWIGKALAMPTKAKVTMKLVTAVDVPESPPKRAAAVPTSRPADSEDNVPEALDIECMVTGMVSGMTLNVALVERNLDVEVPYGTRRTRVKGDHVVRAFASLPIKRAGRQKVHLQAPPDWKPENCSLVAYVQDPRRLGIGGATAIEVAAEK